jgi:hypothetical protein
MSGIYSGPSYSMGDDLEVTAAATAPVTPATSARAKAELARMKRSLRAWLRYRRINDAVATGHGGMVPDAILKRPGKPVAAAAVAARLSSTRALEEAPLAANLYRLLSEVFDPSSLPSPSSPNAAVQLAEIAIAGKLPGEAGAPSPTGFIWLWPAVIVVGAIALVITTKIRSDADEAAEREKYECIKAGKCTDSGFWLKIGAIALGGWILWDKVGLGERVTGALKRRST